MAQLIENVKNQKSEIGVLYLNDYNRTVLEKIFNEAGLSFTPLFEYGIYAYMSKKNPLAGNEEITMSDLDEYPCLAFAQEDYNSFYFAEEVLSTYEYKRLVRANDRATSSEITAKLNGYSIGTGIMTDSITLQDGFVTIKLKEEDPLTIGYITRKNHKLSDIGEMYIEELGKYRKKELI